MAGTQNGTGIARNGSRALVGALVLLVAGAALAAAHWTSQGAGTGAATAADGLPVTIVPGLPPAQLYPGGKADLSQRISNPNPYDVRIGALSLDVGQGAGGYAVDAAHAGCTLSSLTFTTQTNGGTGWTVPAAANGADGSLDVTLSSSLAMGAGAADACQGATFTVYLKVGA